MTDAASLPPWVVERMQRTRMIRQRYWQFANARWRKAGFNPGQFVLGILLCCTVVLIHFGIHMILHAFGEDKPLQEELERESAFAERAEAVMALPLMVNSMLRKPGDAPAPGLFLISFEREWESIPFMGTVALVVGEPPAELPTRDQEFLRELMRDEEYQRGRRRRLPDSVTRGKIVYAVDLMIHPRYLPQKHIHDEMPVVPCLADFGDRGEIRAVPYWIAFDVRPPPWADRTEVFVG